MTVTFRQGTPRFRQAAESDTLDETPRFYQDDDGIWVSKQTGLAKGWSTREILSHERAALAKSRHAMLPRWQALYRYQTRKRFAKLYNLEII